MTTLIAVTIVLGFLVFVHELGHFLVAKWAGVRVQVFSIGFGKRLFGFERDGTDYRISAIPLGGYVKMAGENPNEPATGAPDEFMSKSVWQRMAIIFAGPLMNLIWAVIFIAAVLWIGIERPVMLTEAPMIGWVENDTPAERAGLQRGDKITEINQTEVGTWQDVNSLFATTEITGGKQFRFLVDRQGTPVEMILALPDSLGAGQQNALGFAPPLPAIVGTVTAEWPAEVAGMKPGDQIVAIDDQPISAFYEMTDIVNRNQGTPLNLQIRRDGALLNVVVTPRLDEERDRAMIGISAYREMENVRYGISEALELSVQRNVEIAAMIGTYLKQVFSGEASGKEIGSVIMIAQVAGDAARSGLRETLMLMGFLSLQLGLLNLLPIPVLDGGHLMLFTFEAITRKPVSLRHREIAQGVGLLLLLTIMVYAIFNDIVRYFAS